jgi:hypothetical protein
VEKATRIELPPSVRRPYEVFVNGVAQREGQDFEAIGTSLVFSRPLVRERKLAAWRWLLLFLGVWSSYTRFDTVDVVYNTSSGQRLVASLTPPEVGGGA